MTIKGVRRSMGASEGTSRKLKREVDHDLDVVRRVLKRLAPARQRYAAGDQALEPRLVGPRQRLLAHFIMPAVGVHGAEHGIVVEHRLVIEKAEVDLHDAARRDA